MQARNSGNYLAALGATRRASPPPQVEAEDRFLKALEMATQFSFARGRLVITSQRGDTYPTLVFRRLAVD